VSSDELLARFKPQLRYDSQEAFFADSAEQMTSNPGNELRRGDGTVVARADDGLGLSFLGPAYPDGSAALASDVLSVHGKNYRDQYTRLREARPELNDRVYGHAATGSDGRLWLQYWLFFFYNDYHLAADFGLHEGDWEMVELRLLDEGTPDLAVYAQHSYAEMRTWDDVEKTDDGRPVVYPARGSHAAYFEAGLYETVGWYDIADGKRDSPDLALEILRDDAPPWVVWPGWWGDTKKVKRLDEDSPRGPGPHDQWLDPAGLIEKAIARPRKRPAEPPEVAVDVRHGRLWLVLDLSHRTGPPPVKLVVNVNSPDEPDVPPKSFTFDVQDQPREVDTGLELSPKKRYEIYTSLTVRVDDKDQPTASRLTVVAPGVASALPEWLKRVLWWVRGLFSHR
jgi:Vacuolar protein sorting-associated protein 62